MKVHLHHFSKIKIKKSHKTVETKFFLTIFAKLWKDPDPGGPETCGSDGSGSATLLFTFLCDGGGIRQYQVDTYAGG